MTPRIMSREMKKADQMVCRCIQISLIEKRIAGKITHAKVCKNYRKIRAKKDPVFKA